jgi:hypothetical protein
LPFRIFAVIPKMFLFLLRFSLNTRRWKQQIAVFDGSDKRLAAFVQFTVTDHGFEGSAALLHKITQTHQHQARCFKDSHTETVGHTYLVTNLHFRDANFK